MTFLSRRKTAEFSWDELSATALLGEDDNEQEIASKLKDFVVGTLNGAVVTTTRTTKPEAPSKKVVKKVAKKAPAKKVEEKVEPEVIPSKDEVQNALRAVATHFKTAAKAVAIIESVAGVKTLAEVDPREYVELINQCNKVLEE